MLDRTGLLGRTASVALMFRLTSILFILVGLRFGGWFARSDDAAPPSARIWVYFFPAFSSVPSARILRVSFPFASNAISAQRPSLVKPPKRHTPAPLSAYR